MGSFPNLSRANIVNYRRDSTASNGVREMKRDYVGSTNSLSRKSSKDTFGSTANLSRKSSRDYIGSTNSLSRKSSIDTKKSSTDSLDIWHTSWDSEKNNSISSLAHDDRLSFGYHKVIIINSAASVCDNGQLSFWSIRSPTNSVNYIITLLLCKQAGKCSPLTRKSSLLYKLT